MNPRSRRVESLSTQDHHVDWPLAFTTVGHHDQSPRSVTTVSRRRHSPTGFNGIHVLTALNNSQLLHQSKQNGFLSSILSQRSLPLLASTSAFNPNRVESSTPRSINTGVKYVKRFHVHPSNPNDVESPSIS
ncbi:hypothetical protein AAEP93_009586 [Penicillium crustosum]